MAGTIVCRTVFGLQPRVFLIPWMKKSNGIGCSNGRANSSMPVKYIPKKNLKPEEPKTASRPLIGCEDKVINDGDGLDQNEIRFEGSNCGKSSSRRLALDKNSTNQNKRPIQYLKYPVNQVDKEIDFDEDVVESECLEEPEGFPRELGIHRGKNLQNQDALRTVKTAQDAEKLAIELLASRAYTAVELKKKLLGKRFPLDMVDAVLLDFKSRGLINDCLYAETFSRSRWSSSSWGPRRIKQALFKKGVSEVDAEKAIKLVFQDNSSGGDQESRLGLSKVSVDHLYVQASKQWLRGRDVTNETRKSRIVRWLQYRGFNWGIISFILKKLESEHPP